MIRVSLPHRRRRNRLAKALERSVVRVIATLWLARFLVRRGLLAGR
jgi:hypothetical protein